MNFCTFIFMSKNVKSFCKYCEEDWRVLACPSHFYIKKDKIKKDKIKREKKFLRDLAL